MNQRISDEIANGSKNGAGDRYLQFSLGNEKYAIPLLEVREVIPPPETTTMPNGPAYFVGIMNLRGQIISIVDLRKKLNIKPAEQGVEEAVIIVCLEGVSIGLVVDSINKVVNLGSQEISEIPEIKSQVNAKYIYGVFKREEELTLLLDISIVLQIQEILKLSKNAA